MKAIIDEQLEEVLTKLNVWDDVASGLVFCAHCHKTISTENIGAFIPRRNDDGSRRIELFCNEPACINALLSSK